MNVFTTTTASQGLSGPEILSAIAAVHRKLIEKRIDAMRKVLREEALRSPLWLTEGRVEGQVRVEHLGPPGREFKIVRLLDGQRVLVDQETEVEDPFRVRVNWAELPAIREPRHLVRVSVS